MGSIPLDILTKGKFNKLTKILLILIIISCNNDDSKIFHDVVNSYEPTDEDGRVELVKRAGSRPQTTSGVPHVQIGVEPVSVVTKELYRRVLSIPGIENHPSVIPGWEGLWVAENMEVAEPNALISGREFGHIHDDGSLHIFLEPSRSNEAVQTCWAIFHPFAIEERPGWNGFVMLYTPQSIEELNVTFQLIVDGFNYVTGQNLKATKYY